jgi:hypothetical protein
VNLYLLTVKISFMKKKIIVFKNEHELVTLIKHILKQLKGNAAFPTPPEALAELEKMLPELEEALERAKTRDRSWVAIKNNKKAIAIALLEVLADYVLAISKGDLAMIFSSGFTVEESNGSEKTSIELLEVILNAPGQATLHAKNHKNAVAYVHQYTTEEPGPNTLWHSAGSTKGDYTFTGLTTDKRYWFRVMAVGRKGQQVFSPVISRSIQ